MTAFNGLEKTEETAMRELRGKNAVITGGGSGIGRGMALAFAREGMNVLVSDIEPDAAEAVAAEVRALGRQGIAAPTDVARLADVQALSRLAFDSFQEVHVLCPNAGVAHARRGIHATHQDWVWMLGVNLWGVIHCIETFLPRMLGQQEPSHIVVTASMNGIFPSAYSAMYSTAKYGLMGLVETLRNELKGSRVSISALCPALVTTRLFESERNRPADLMPDTPPPPHVRSTSFDISPPIAPEVVGDLVVHGIRRDQLHIFTDMKVKDLIEAHHRQMMAGFDELAAWENDHVTIPADPALDGQEITVIASNAVRNAYLKLVPAFEKTSGHKVTTMWGGTGDITKRIADGAVVDIVIVGQSGIDSLVKQGKLVPGSPIGIARSIVGAAVRIGAPRPDLSSGQSLRASLLAAKSIVLSSGPAGMYLGELFQRMGIADQITSRVIHLKPGVPVAHALARGEGDLGFTQVSEFLAEEGIDYVGPLPSDIQRITVFSAGIHVAAPAPQAAEAWLTFLTAPQAAPILRASGLEPG
jgi:molybdate transport system substrate-binding protein